MRVRLSKEEKKELANIMVHGNTLLKQCAEMMNLTHREFRGKLFNRKLDTSKLSAEQLAFLNSAIPHIMEVRNKCEAKLLAGYERMVHKQAYLAARNNHDPRSARQEFIQEGTIALLDGIYGYTDSKIKFMTFFWSCVRNRLLVAINRMNPLCPLTNEAIDILQRVEKERLKINNSVSDQVIITNLGLTPKEQKVYNAALTKVVNEEKSDSEFLQDDYTSKRRGVDSVNDVFFIREEARQAVKDANLDDLEMDCLFSDLYEYHGWQEDVARKHINKKTGKRFTRQYIKFVLERAHKKVKNAYTCPPKIHRENSRVDQFFDSWSAEKVIKEDKL